MVAFTRDTFVIYDEEYHTGAVEEIQRAAIELNSAAGGVMRMSTQTMRGEFLRESFYQDIQGLVRDRNPTDLGDSTPDDLTMGEEVSVKVHKSIHVEKALNAFKGLGNSPQEFSFVVGAVQGKRMAVDYMDTAISAVTAALRSQATVQYDATATSKKSISPANLNRIKKRLGDQSQRVRAWVMDSTMLHDLVEENIESGITDVAGVVVYGGSPATLGLPVIMTDSPYLMTENVDPTLEDHYVLALCEGAVEVIEAEERSVLAETVGGKKNLIGRIQSEYAIMATVSGASYKGSQYPTKADLADPTNWEYVVSDIKGGCGAIGIFNARVES
jgi:hypothetical protein